MDEGARTLHPNDTGRHDGVDELVVLLEITEDSIEVFQLDLGPMTACLHGGDTVGLGGGACEGAAVRGTHGLECGWAGVGRDQQECGEHTH